MFSITKPSVGLFTLSLLILANIGWAGDSCNALLNLGLYNVTQSSNSADGQSMAKSTFCSADYSQIDESSSQAGQISASYGLFSGGASVSASRSEIITRQSEVCTSGFNSSAYSTQASDYAKTVYQGSLDAWNKCQALANKGIIFNIQPSSTLQGVSVSITAPTGLSAKFLGVAQQGSGHSDCTTSANGKLLDVGPSTPFKFTAASIITINCARQLDVNGSDLTADAQDLIFMTSADNLIVPLQAIGSMSRMSVDQIEAKITANTNNTLDAFQANTINGLISADSSQNSKIRNLTQQIANINTRTTSLECMNVSGGNAGSDFGYPTANRGVACPVGYNLTYCYGGDNRMGYPVANNVCVTGAPDWAGAVCCRTVTK